MIGEDVDLDLLFLFPKKCARIMGGIKGETSFSKATMEEREGGKTSCPREKKGPFIAPPTKMTVGLKKRCYRLKRDNPGQIFSNIRPLYCGLRNGAAKYLKITFRAG